MPSATPCRSHQRAHLPHPRGIERGDVVGRHVGLKVDVAKAVLRRPGDRPLDRLRPGRIESEPAGGVGGMGGMGGVDVPTHGSFYPALPVIDRATVDRK